MIGYTFRQLEYALEIERLGTVAAAAAALGIAQPSLSAALQKLETQIGLQLFIRHHAQGMRPTPGGARFLAEARAIVKRADDLQRQAYDAEGAISGELSLGCYATLAPMFLPALLKAFNRLHPRARIHIAEGRQDDLLGGLRHGRFDMALLYDVGLPEDLSVQHLQSLAPYVLLPGGHRLARLRKISLFALKQEPFILLDVPPSRTYFLGLLKSLGLPDEPAYSSPSLEFVRGLVGQGLGYSLLITRPHGDHAYDGSPLVIRPVVEDMEPGRIGLARLESVKPTRLAMAFQTFAAEFFTRRTV